MENQERLLTLFDIIGNRKKQTLGRIPFSKSKLYALIKNKQFPAQIKCGRQSFWRASDINQYINNLNNKSMEGGEK